jgi:hypothetical protein
VVLVLELLLVQTTDLEHAQELLVVVYFLARVEAVEVQMDLVVVHLPI